MPQDLGMLSTPIQSDIAISLFSDDTIEFNGCKYQPDETKGYFKFQLSTGFPAGATAYGTGLWAGTISRSYNSLMHQPLNYEHQVRAYAKESDKNTSVKDRFIGSILSVDFPSAPGGGWRLDGRNDPPHITGVACFAKLAEAMGKVVGEHQTSRHQYSVSMEVQYYPQKSGLAVALNGKKPEFKDTTPDHFEAAGYEYVPWSEAPDKLRKTFSSERNRIVGKYNNRDSYMLMGGLDGTVHYAGVGLVKYGAEKTAGISRIVASGEHPLITPLVELTQLFEDALASVSKR